MAQKKNILHKLLSETHSCPPSLRGIFWAFSKNIKKYLWNASLLSNKNPVFIGQKPFLLLFLNFFMFKNVLRVIFIQIFSKIFFPTPPLRENRVKFNENKEKCLIFDLNMKINASNCMVSSFIGYLLMYHYEMYLSWKNGVI